MDDELKHWKYLKREKKGGKWVYTYPDDKAKNKTADSETEKEADKVTTVEGDESKKSPTVKLNDLYTGLKKKLSDAIDKTKETVKGKTVEITTSTAEKALTALNSSEDKINSTIDKTKETFNKIYDDPDNIYNVTSLSYDDKVAKIKETEEWQDIVKRKDPEYVKTTADGQTKYLIDEYIVDKKHPILDAIGDISEGREVSFNEITAETTIAGLKETAFGVITTGMLAAGVLSKVLTEKFKLQQGSYDDDINSLVESVNRGEDVVKQYTTSEVTISEAQLRQLSNMLAVANAIRTETNEVDEGNIIAATQIILNAKPVKDAVGSNEYYQMAETSLSSLSEEEIMAVNLLLQELRKR